MNEGVEIPSEGLSIDLLRAVYRNNQLELSTRMRAASLAIPYECARLGVSVVVNNTQDFASLLDARIARFEQMKLIEAQPTNNPEPTNGNGSERSEVTEVKPIDRAPLSRIYSNRFRRRL